MLAQISIGDAAGMGFEYCSGLNLPKNDLSSFKQHPLHHELKPGMYTDDTQQALAIAEMVLSYKSGTFEFTEVGCCNMFVDCFKRDQRKGYSRQFQTLLEEVSSGRELLERINSHGRTNKNGAAMRVAPLVYLTDDLEELKRINKIVSGSTHTGTGINAAECVLVCCWLLRYKKIKLNQLTSKIKEMFDPKLELDKPWLKPVKSDVDLGLITVRGAITCILSSNGKLSDVIKNGIDLQGDTDSTCAIAAAMASQSEEIIDDITTDNSQYNHLMFQMENGTYGIDYLKQIDKQLEERNKINNGKS